MTAASACRLLAVVVALSACKRTEPGPSRASAAVAASSVASAPAPPAPKSAASIAPVDRRRIEADVRFIAKPRAPGSAHHAAVGKYCEEQLKKSGYQVSRQAFTSGENILAEKAGKAARTVVLSAHYDHIPYCDGADDNATGVAVVLEAARVLAPLSFDNRLVLACWDDEEAGLNGSAAYASRALERSEDIALAIALDGVGFTNSAPNSQTVPPGFDRLFPEMKARLDALGGRATFAAVLGDTAAAAGIAALERHAAAAKLPLISAALGTLQRLALLDAARSDHASFWLQGFPALLISDTANFRNPRYHCGEGQDDVQSLDFAFTTAIAQTVAGAVAQLLASGTPSP